VFQDILPVLLGTALLVAISCLLLWGVRRHDFSRSYEGQGLSVLLVVRNQADLLEGMVRRLHSLLSGSRLAPCAEIVLVAEASRDDTPAIATRLARVLDGVRASAWQPRDGRFSSAIEVGYFLCRYPLVILSHPRCHDDWLSLLWGIYCLAASVPESQAQRAS